MTKAFTIPPGRTAACVAVAWVIALVGNSRPVSAQSVSAPAILQWFDSSYDTQAKRVADFFRAGYGSTWIPPTGRADSGGLSVGYDVFDRFDLGSPNNQTLYGSEAGLRRFVDVMHRSSGSVMVDLVWNHNGFSDLDRSGFVAQGGYPGFLMTRSGAPDGDFHAKTDTGDLNGRLAGLIDIKHETNFQYIRSPIDPADTRNIPAGTIWNRADPANTRFYADRNQPGITRFNPLTGQTVTLYDFNVSDPTAGDPVLENATGLLMRNARWLVNDVGVDGFRLDAARHFEPWLYGYFDEAVYRASRRTLLNGAPREVFSISESASTDRANLMSQFVRKDIATVPANQIGGNRDALDFAQFWPVKNNLAASGVGNDFRNMVNAGLDVYDDGLVNGSAGVVFVQSHDDFGPDMMNVAYAFSLMRPGNAVVYYNAYEHYDPARAFPKPGRGDALGNFGGTITTLVDLRNRYGRGDYRERLLEKENYAFERSNSALVMLSNRNDAGFDARSMAVDFTLGTRLVELTGNAAAVNLRSGSSVIPEVLQVVGTSGSRFVNARFLRNDGRDQGYLVYGLPTPRSTAGIEFSGTGVGALVAGDDPPEFVGGETTDQTRTIMIANAQARLASMRVINGDSFTVRLATQAVTLADGYRDRSADGDQAMLRINEGLDLNGSGAVDVVSPGDVSYGFENFATTRITGFSQANGNGLYEQAIDARLLPEGMNFLTVRAYRHRNPATGGDNGPAVYSEFKQVLYVDRLAPEAGFDRFQPFSGGVGNNDVWIKSLDGTADSVNIFQNVAANVSDATILAWADAGQGRTDRLDADIFKTGFFGVPNGNNTYTVVTREITGTRSVRRFTGRRPSSGRGAGLGDLNFDGSWTAADMSDAGFGFERIHNAKNSEFNAAADVTGDGLVDTRDMLALETSLTTSGSAAAAALAELANVKFRRVNFQNDAVLNETDLALLRVNVGLPLSGDALWTYDLDVDGAVTDADVTMAQERFNAAPTAGVPTTLTWTGNDALPGGSGNWTASGLAWRGGVTASGTLPMPLVPGSRAVFSGGAATVTVSGSVRALGGLDFQAPGSSTLAGGTLALGGASGGGNVINVVASGTALVTSRIVGADGLVKTGAGRLTLTGSSTFPVTTVVSAGTLAVGNAGTIGSLSGPVRIDAAGTLAFNRSNAMTMASVLSGSGAVVQIGLGTTTLAAANTLTGPVTVSAGVLALGADGSIASSQVVKVDAGATLDVTAKVGGYAVPAGQTLAGAGSVAGAVSLGTGATLSPGASPGTLTITGNATFGSGGNYNWQIYDASGTAGVTSGWDLVTIDGTLAVASTSADRFNLNLWSLAGVGPDVNGNALNFNATTSGTWRIASAAGGITGFSADKFSINVSATNGTGGFTNSLSGGTFSLAQSGTALNLVFTPASAGPAAIVINVGSGSTQTQAQAGYPALTPAIATSVTKTGPGTLVFDAANTYTGTTSVNAGTLLVTNSNALPASPIVVQTSGTLALPTASRLVLSATSLAVDQATGGTVDIGKGRINVAVGGTTEADLRADLIAGRSGGTFSGTSGIMTTGGVAGAATQAVVGYRVFTSGSAIVAWAAFGDSNLDGQVNLTDVSLINNGGKFGQGSSTGATWSQGDYNYSGGVTLTDISLLNNAALYNAGSYLPVSGLGSLGLDDTTSAFLAFGSAGEVLSQPSLGAIASVPEPSGGLLAVIGMSLAAAAGLRISVPRGRRRRIGSGPAPRT